MKDMNLQNRGLIPELIAKDEDKAHFFFFFLRMKAHLYYKKCIQHIYPHKFPLIIYKVTHKFGYNGIDLAKRTMILDQLNKIIH